MLGTYLLTKIDQIANKRTKAQRQNNFSIYVDEYHLFLDDHLARNFGFIRNMGFGYVVAHQTFDQLAENDPNEARKGTIFSNTSTRFQKESFRVILPSCTG